MLPDRQSGKRHAIFGPPDEHRGTPARRLLVLAAKMKESLMFAAIGYLALGMLAFAGLYLLTHVLERV